MKTILKAKWHLHALIIILMQPIIMYSDKNPEWFDFGNVGNFWRWFILTLASFCLGFVVEWIQRKFFGAHKELGGNKRSWQDIYATTVAGAVGIAVNELWFAVGVLTAIIILEVIRRKNK
jgi:hypothetical protein